MKKFFEELSRRLREGGVESSNVEDRRLEIFLHGQPVLFVSPGNDVFLFPAGSNNPEASELYHRVAQTADEVYTYVEEVQTAPTLHISGLSEKFHLLADFGGAVLAGRELENGRGYQFVTWIWDYMTANVGTVFSASSLAKFFKNEQRTVAAETILNYVRYCCDAYLFYQVKRQDLQGKQILASNEKYYIADHGIREAVFGGNMKDINLILENIVYMELLRRGYVVTVGRAGEKEIDFVCEKRGEKLYVQVTYLLASEDTVKREFGAYDGIQDNFPKYVVSLDEFDMSRNGIKHRNIRDFLLAEEWN